jgi:hypothetical protein
VSRNLILNFVWKWRLNKLEHLFQALLHPYFFKEPLPAHHSELPIPARNSRRLGTRAAVGKLFDTEAPLEKSLVPPNDIKPYIRKWLAACIFHMWSMLMLFLWEKVCMTSELIVSNTS